MNDLKSELSAIFNKLKGIEERARGLKNQNLADIAASAKGRVQQLCDHPDTELIADRKDQSPDGKVYEAPTTKEDAIDRMRADGDADPEGTARMNWPHLFDTPSSVTPPYAPPPVTPQPSSPPQQATGGSAGGLAQAQRNSAAR